MKPSGQTIQFVCWSHSSLQSLYLYQRKFKFNKSLLSYVYISPCTYANVWFKWVNAVLPTTLFRPCRTSWMRPPCAGAPVATSSLCFWRFLCSRSTSWYNYYSWGQKTILIYLEGVPVKLGIVGSSLLFPTTELCGFFSYFHISDSCKTRATGTVRLGCSVQKFHYLCVSLCADWELYL